MSANLWNEVLSQIQRHINSHSFDTWFKPTKLVSASGKILTVIVPNTLFAEWLRKNYLPLILQIVQEIKGEEWEVEFTTPDEDSPTGRSAKARAPSGTAAVGGSIPPSRPRGSGASERQPRGRFNAIYTFDSFVEGPANQFALAAAKAVAERPSKSYNPLYIYGGVGLGKTHLLQAIGNHLVASGKSLKVHYTTTERFMNDLITSIRFENTMAFKDIYRSVDVLLVDDIQFLADKERTQDEFFHTFNSLYDAQKQIVLTADCAPAEIMPMEERLVSRFQWGLMADIQPPDLETRIAILKKKADAEGVDLASDVALFIASRIKSNVRELEGYLTRIIAEASMKDSQIDMNLAKVALQNMVPSRPPVVPFDSILMKVADHHGLKVSDLKSKNNARSISFPRQVAMWLCKNLTDLSLPEIGRRFGGKHHTTVLHAIRKIERLRGEDRDFDRLLNTFIQALR